MRVRKQLWFAGAAAGALVAASSGPALAQDINDTVNGPSSGVVAAGVGTQNVTVTITKKGDVNNPGGTAVTASAQLGNVTVTDNGQVAGTTGGIFGLTSGPAVSVTVNQSVTGGAGNAVEALNDAVGAASITIGPGQNAKHPLTISTTGKVGAGAVSGAGAANIQVGGNVSISAGAAGEVGTVDVLALGVFTPSDTNGPSAVATVGQNATLTLLGNNGAAVAAEIGQSGGEGPNGSASTRIVIGNGVDINVSGLSDAGVIGYVRDLSGLGLYAGTGDVNVTVGTGTINVNENGAVGVAAGAATNVGEGAFSAGGNVSIANAADITVSGGQDASIGIDATTTGAGQVSITSSGSVASTNGDAINAGSGAGAVTVNLTGGDITSSAVGVNATSGSGAISITTANPTAVVAGGDGIDANTNGSVIVNVAGDVTAGGFGLHATSSSGAVGVSVANSSSIVAGGIGIDAQSAGAVVVDDEGTVAAGADGVFAESTGGSVLVTIGGNVASAHGADAVEGFADGPGAAVVVVGSGKNAAHPLTISGGQTGGVIGVSLFGPVSVSAGDNVSITSGAAGVSRITDIGAIAVLTAADQGGVGAEVSVGRNATLTLTGNQAAAVTAQIGQTGLFGPFNGTASATASVGDGVAINVAGLDDAGVIAFVTDISPGHLYAGSGDASVTVGTGSITINETGAIGAPPGAATNIGEGAFSAGGNVSISNAANVSVTGGQDSVVGLEAETAGAGSSTIVTRGDITVAGGAGDAIFASTQNGANLIQVDGGALTGTDAAVAANTFAGPITIDVASGAQLTGNTGVRMSSFAGSGAMTLDNAGQIISLGAAAVQVSGSGGSAEIDNAGVIGTVSTLHLGPAVLSVASQLTLSNEAGGLIDGVITVDNNLTFDNAGLWRTAGVSDLGFGAGVGSTSVVNNTGLIQVGEDGAGGAPMAASILDVAAFNNGSASRTGAVSMINGHVGDSLTVGGPFIGAPGHSLLGLDVQLGGPGSTADQLILNGGSAGQTLIVVNDVLHGPGALNPGGIVLVQGSSGASTFALDPHQPGYDPATKGIDKGLFTYPLVFTGGNEVLVGEPGLTAHQMATWGAAAEDIWSATDPGDQSEAHLASSLANGDGDDTGGLHVWAQAVNGGPSRLNRGQTMLGRASFAGDPSADGAMAGGAPLAGLAQQTSSFSAYGMTYGFDTGYAQNVSALLTGVDLARHVGERDAWSWGVSTGYLESQQSFTAGSSIAQYQGALAAVHGAYVNANGFHVAGDVKMTALQLSYATAWGGGGANAPNVAIDTFGGEADAGWTRPLGGGWTLDPIASLSMQTSKLGALAIQGTSLRFGDASSVRLGFGARLNGGGHIFGLTWKSQSQLTMWDELRGANTLQMVGLGPNGVLPDPIGGTFTDASEQLSLASPDGRASAFVAGGYRWKSDYQAAQLSMGVKLAW